MAREHTTRDITGKMGFGREDMEKWALWRGIKEVDFIGLLLLCLLE